MTLEELLEIESIKQTRTLGARHLDAGDWDALADLYTSDARCEFGPYGTWRTSRRSRGCSVRRRRRS